MLEQIDPEKFLYEYYSCNALDFLDNNEIARNAVGWCDASRLLVRPRRDLFALMLEMPDDEKIWFHIDQKMLSLIEKRRAKLGIS